MLLLLRSCNMADLMHNPFHTQDADTGGLQSALSTHSVSTAVMWRNRLQEAVTIKKTSFPTYILANRRGQQKTKQLFQRCGHDCSRKPSCNDSQVNVKEIRGAPAGIKTPTRVLLFFSQGEGRHLILVPETCGCLI